MSQNNTKKEIKKREGKMLLYMFELLAKEGWITEKEKNEVKHLIMNQVTYL